LVFLAHSGSVESAQLILNSWTRFPLSLRENLVGWLGSRDFKQRTATLEPAGAEVQKILREILLTALEDERGFPGVAMSNFNSTVHGPRLCDLAANALYQHWPDEFQFNLYSSESARERQRLAILNPVRRDRGLDEYPLPPELPRLRPAQANRVTSIKTDEANVPKAYVGKLHGLKGNALTSEWLIGFLRDFAIHRPADIVGLQIQATRSSELTGVTLGVSFIHGNVPTTGSYSDQQSVLLSARSLLFSGGVGIASGVKERKHWSQLGTAVEAALKSRPEETYHIFVSLAFSE
jgi:hypothetical protein